MKNFIILFALAGLLSGCAFTAAPVSGLIYTDLQYGGVPTSNPVATKVGTAEVTSILGIVATGNASINEAAQKANISQISHVDYEVKSILGIYATWTIYVYGE